MLIHWTRFESFSWAEIYGNMDALTIIAKPPDLYLEIFFLCLQTISYPGIWIESKSSTFVSCTPIISYELIRSVNSGNRSLLFRPQVFMLRNFKFSTVKVLLCSFTKNFPLFTLSDKLTSLLLLFPTDCYWFTPLTEFLLSGELSRDADGPI